MSVRVQHIKQQYQAAQPLLQALTAAYPEDITPGMVDEDMFTWACELWYSYAIEVCQHPSITQHVIWRLLHQAQQNCCGQQCPVRTTLKEMPCTFYVNGCNQVVLDGEANIVVLLRKPA